MAKTPREGVLSSACEEKEIFLTTKAALVAQRVQRRQEAGRSTSATQIATVQGVPLRQTNVSPQLSVQPCGLQ